MRPVTCFQPRPLRTLIGVTVSDRSPIFTLEGTAPLDAESNVVERCTKARQARNCRRARTHH
jgi:hypothetical protein